MKTRSVNKIAETLKDCGLSQRWLASKLKVNESTVSRWVNKKTDPHLKTIYIISSEFIMAGHDIQPRDLINEEIL